MKLGNIFKSDKMKFVLSVGDEGAILTCVEGSKMLKRLFVNTPTSAEFKEFLAVFPTAPLYMLVDVVDQAYIQQTLPPVSAMNVKKLVKRKLAKDFDAKDLTHAIKLKKEKGSKKEWTYLFVSARNTSPLTDWIEAVSNIPNRFMGIYLLPVESMTLLKNLNNALNTGVKEKNKVGDCWQIMVSHNRVGGFRQIVYKNGVIIFTRIAQPVGGQTPNVVAGNIEQETLNTIEYIRRLGYVGENNLDIFIITSSEVKEVLEQNSLPSATPYILTPFEVAQQLKLKNASEPRDRFGDVVTAIHFLSCKKHVLKLHTDYTKKVEQLIKAKTALKGFAVLGVIALLCLTAASIISSFSIMNKYELSKKDKIVKENSFNIAKKKRESYNESPELIKEIASVNKTLTKDSSFYKDFIAMFPSADDYNMYFKKVSLKITEETKKHNTIDASLIVVFVGGKDLTIDQIFDEIDLFTSETEKIFKDYEISFFNLPKDQIHKLSAGQEVDQKEKSFSITINISGPGKKKKIRGKR